MSENSSVFRCNRRLGVRGYIDTYYITLFWLKVGPQSEQRDHRIWKPNSLRLKSLQQRSPVENKSYCHVFQELNLLIAIVLERSWLGVVDTMVY